MIFQWRTKPEHLKNDVYMRVKDNQFSLMCYVSICTCVRFCFPYKAALVRRSEGVH